MDDFDWASELEEGHRMRSIAAVRAALGEGESAHHCEDCDEPIPLARRQAVKGCRRCIDCQARHECGQRYA